MHGLRAQPWPLLLLLLSGITNPCASATTTITTLLPRAEDGPVGLEITHTGGPSVCERPTQAGDTIAVHYRGTLAATGDEFDASYNRGEPFTFTLGAGHVIAGWDQGLVGMCVGESRQLTIPPELGYGHSGTGPIPPDAVLVFDTRLEDLVALAPGSESVVSSPSSSSAPVGLPGADETAVVTATGASATGASTSGTSIIATSAASTADADSTASSAADAATATEDGILTIATAPPTPPELDMEEEEKAGDDGVTVTGGASEWEDEQNMALEDSQLGEVDGTPLPDAHETASTAAETVAAMEDEQGECHLLGTFAVFVQGALGALALLALVWKRWREQPKRPWKIFCFDASKQIFGSMLVHVINIAMSKLGSDGMQTDFSQAGTDAAGRKPNPCSFYLLNLFIDTTAGVPVLYVLLKIFYALFLFTPLARPPQSITSGHYGQPPKVTWYLKQLLIYCLGLIGMKGFVYFLLKAMPWLAWVGDWALRWTKGNEALEITFSMFIFPLAMNAVQYYVIDNFIMDKKAEEHGYLQVGSDEDPEERQRMMGSDDGDADAADVQHVRGKHGDNSDSDSSLNRSNNFAGSLARGSAGNSRSPPSDRSKQA